MCTYYFFFFNDTATTEIYTLSLHDALPIFRRARVLAAAPRLRSTSRDLSPYGDSWHSGSSSSRPRVRRSEEHTSELQSRQYLVCRLLLEKKKKKHIQTVRSLISTPSYSHSS